MMTSDASVHRVLPWQSPDTVISQSTKSIRLVRQSLTVPRYISAMPDITTVRRCGRIEQVRRAQFHSIRRLCFGHLSCGAANGDAAAG
eukprot:4284874-Pleurochrysis_carterae.AAC.2